MHAVLGTCLQRVWVGGCTSCALLQAVVQVGLIHAASVGQLQLSLGTTLPPRACMQESICSTSAGKEASCTQIQITHQ